MVDPFRCDVLFDVILAERQELVRACTAPWLPAPLPRPVAVLAAVAGRASVRLGTWLQGLAEPCRAPGCAGAPR